MENNFKVGMLIFIQHDLEKAFEFYKSVGLNPKFHLEGRWAEFELGNTKLGLCPTEKELPDRHTGVVIEVEDMNKVFNDLQAKGIEFINEPKEAPHGIMASIKDPGNNIFDIYQPTPEKVQEMVKDAADKEKQNQASGCSDKSDCSDKKDDCCKDDANKDGCCKSE